MDNEKLIKTVIIARSGIYQYRKEELPSLNVTPQEDKEVYNVYRPAIVLVNSKDKFSMLPLTNGHPKELVDGDNFKELTIGFTGENVSPEWNSEITEVVLKTKVALVDNQALENYYVGVDEVSLGYQGIFIWQPGTTYKEEPFDIVMTDITKGNHLAMTPKARAGAVACIIDSKGGKMDAIKLVTHLWRSIRKKLSVNDSDTSFRLIATDLVNNRATLSDEDVMKKINLLRELTYDLPDNDEKALLRKYIDDFSIVKQKDDASAKEAVELLSSLYEKLDVSLFDNNKGGTMEGNEQNKTVTTVPNKDEEVKKPEVTPPKDEGETVSTKSPEQAFIEGLETLFMEYHKSKNPGDQGGAQTTPPTVQTPAKDGEGCITTAKPKDEEKPKEEEKTKVGDSVVITEDSSFKDKPGLTSFFNKNVKKGRE